MKNKGRQISCVCGACRVCRDRKKREAYFRKRNAAKRAATASKAKPEREPKVVRKPDPAVDPWEFENWCRKAESERRTVTYDRGGSALNGEI
jgi:hypothetical protein